MKSLEDDKLKAAGKYTRARSALLNLGLSDADKTLRPLDTQKLWSKNYLAQAKLGDGKREDPWFWNVGQVSFSSKKDDWTTESMSRHNWSAGYLIC